MRQRGIRHLPVVDDDVLVGLVSDRDLKQAMASSATSLETHELNYLLEALTVDEIMTRAVITVGRTFPIEEAARLMVKEKVSALPVTETGRLVGIVTETDVLEMFVKTMDAGEPSSRIDVMLTERTAPLADLVHAIEEAQAGIFSVMTLVDSAGRRDVVVRVKTIDSSPPSPASRPEATSCVVHSEAEPCAFCSQSTARRMQRQRPHSLSSSRCRRPRRYGSWLS